LLFEETDFFTTRNINVKDYESLGVWLPTYRSSIIGDIRNDGVFNEDGISFLSMEELARLDTFLQDRKALLIIKLHPMDALQEKEFGEFSNITIIKPKDFDGQLYPLLGASDYLLTDYSSVWIDYCILKRPIGFVMNDIEEYRASRGLTIENLDEKLPGTIIDSYEKLKEFITKRPEFNDKHLSLYNSYCDNKSAERLSRQLGI
jgi:CDP-glycerol glycerophosphotransferase (TagB/SpsB family)